MGIVYMAMNTINGKCYIGKTIQPLGFRRSDHHKLARNGSPTAFHAAIRKYGKKAFYWDILFESELEQLLSIVEVTLIYENGTRCPGGYNLTSGGDGISGLVHSQATRDKMSHSHTGRRISDRQRKAYALLADMRRDKKRDPAIGRKISLSLMGHAVSAETCRKMAAAGPRPHGEQAAGHKLSTADVVTIRQMRADGHTLAAIGTTFGTDYTNVAMIIHRKTWKHLPDFQAGRRRWLESKGTLRPELAALKARAPKE